MAGILHTYIPNRVIDSNGIADGSSIAFFVTGTLTPAPIYTTDALSVEMTNPVVVASGAAVPNIYLDPDITYRRKITFSDGSTQDTDPWTNFAGASVSFIQSGDDSVERTLQDKAREVVSVKDKGAKGDTVRDVVTGIVESGTDDTDAFQAAIDQAVASPNYGLNIFIPPGNYRITDTLRIDKNHVRLFGSGDQSCLVFDPPEDDMPLFLVQNADTDELINYITLEHFAFVSNLDGVAADFNKTGIKLIDASTVLINRVNILDYSWTGGSGLGSVGFWFAGRDTHTVRDCVINADQPIYGDKNPNHTKYVFDCNNFSGLWLNVLEPENYAIHFGPGCIPTNWDVGNNTNTYSGKGGIFLDNDGAVPDPETPSMIRISQFRCEAGTLGGGAAGGYGIFMDFGTGNPACGNIMIENFSVNNDDCNGIAINNASSVSMDHVNLLVDGGTAVSLTAVQQCKVFSLGVLNTSTVAFTDMEPRGLDRLADAVPGDKSIAEALYVRNAAGTPAGNLSYENGIRKWSKTLTIANAGTLDLPTLTASQIMKVAITSPAGVGFYTVTSGSVGVTPGSDTGYGANGSGAVTVEASATPLTYQIRNISGGNSYPFIIETWSAG
jgi:hypothetical protein